MKNTNDILERILLNMRYDSKKTLNENKGELEKYLLLEEQQIPTTMNQIMQFQNWVWKNVDKLGDPEKADKKKLYNTKLCDKPCTVYGKQVYNKDSGHYHRKGGAIDGFYGGNTKKLWGQYKSSYIKANPEWNQADVKVREKLLGKTYPTTSQEIKNFQRYYLEEIENYDKESANPESKIETKLCDKPCLYGEAVDGVLGDNTKKIWNTHGEEYKKENKQWSISIPWDKKTQEDQEILKARIDLAPLLRFSISNPSGWDFTTQLPDAIPTGYLNKIAHKNSASCPFYWGWGINNKVFPYPREYSQEIIDKVKLATKRETEKENKAREEARVVLDQVTKERNAYAEKERKNLDWHRGMSDRLGPNYRPDPGGIGPTKGELEYKSLNDGWSEREGEQYNKIEKARNKVFGAVTQWNTDLPKVKAAIPIRCKRPMKFCDTQDNSNCAYMSYSDVCKNAGGLWVYGVGTNGETCGCRNMGDPAFNQSSMSGYMTQIMGSKGKSFTTTFHLDKSMAWQTPGTGGLDIKAKADTHTNMMWAELGLMVLGFAASATGVAAPLAPLFFGAAAAVGVADGVMYIQEGDTHMGVMMIGLSMLGAGEVGTLIKGVKAEGKAVKFIKTYGEDGFKTFMTKALRNPELLTSSEKILFNELKAAAITHQRVMGIEIRKKIAKTFIEQLPKQSAKWSFKDISKLFVKLTTQQPSLKGIVIYIAGVPYTIDQVYLALYGNDNDRQRSSIGMIYNWLYDKGYAPNKSGVETGTFKDGKYTNPQINKEKEKYLKDQFLIKLQASLQQEAQMDNLVQELVSSLGDVVSADKIMTDNQLAQWMKKNTSNPKGFDQAKYDELLKKQQEEQQKEQKRIKNLEGCNLLDSIKTLSTGDSAVYKEYKDKIQFLKDKIKSNKKEDFINGKCNDVEFFWKRIDTKPGDKDFDFAKQAQRDTRTIVNNPNSQKNESYNIRLNKIIKENLKKYIR